jgi:hypothetical protein
LASYTEREDRSWRLNEQRAKENIRIYAKNEAAGTRKSDKIKEIRGSRYVARTREMRNAKEMLVTKIEGKRQHGRCRRTYMRG